MDDDECNYKTKRELIKTLADLKEEQGIQRNDIKMLKEESKHHDGVHEKVLLHQADADRKLSDILNKVDGRERYEQGLKHGVAGLWLVILAAASAVVAWFGRGNG